MRDVNLEIEKGEFCVIVGASGAILTWFKNMLLPGAWEAEAVNRGMNIYDLIGEKAAAAPLGAGGVVMLDYFQGNRAPYADSSARGMFAGLSIGTDTACIARAIFEGVAYGTLAGKLSDGKYKEILFGIPS